MACALKTREECSRAPSVRQSFQCGRPDVSRLATVLAPLCGVVKSLRRQGRLSLVNTTVISCVMKNILVTGGAGFIGSHLVDRLLSEGDWQVSVVDDFNDFYDPAIKHATASRHEQNSNYRLFAADIRDRDALKQIFSSQPFDVIVHLAARAGVRPSLAQPLLYAETNINGTINLLEFAREHGIRQFVFGSSSSVYGVNEKVPFSEDDPIFNPISPYAATKAAGELICHTYAHLYDMRIVCLRFFTVYGARQRPDLAIHKFAKLISEEKPIPVFGDGSTRRDYTYVDDIIAGVRAAIDYQATDRKS